MKNKKWLILLPTVLIVIIVIGFLYKTSVPKKEKIEKTKYETININWKEVCPVSFEGYNGQAYVVLNCKEVDSLEERKTLEENEFIKNRGYYIDNYTSEQIEEVLGRRNNVLSLGQQSFCQIANGTNLSNGDVVTANCKNDLLKELGYSFDDSFTIEVSGLEEIPEGPHIIETPPKESTPIIDYTTKANIKTLRDDTIYIAPADINEYILEDEYQNKGNIFLVIDKEEDFEIAIEKSLKSNIEFIFYDGMVYTRESNFKECEPYKGVTGR